MGDRAWRGAEQTLLEATGLGVDLAVELATAPVSEAMDSRALVLPADASAAAAAALMIERGCGGAPVIDDAGRLVGFVSTGDFVRHREELDSRRGRGRSAEHTRDGRVVRLARGFHIVSSDEATTVDAAMTPFAYALPPNAPIGKAIALMTFEGIHRLPIVDGARRVVGVLSTLDALRWLKRRAEWPGAAELARRAPRARGEEEEVA